MDIKKETVSALFRHTFYGLHAASDAACLNVDPVVQLRIILILRRKCREDGAECPEIRIIFLRYSLQAEHELNIADVIRENRVLQENGVPFSDTGENIIKFQCFLPEVLFSEHRNAAECLRRVRCLSVCVETFLLPADPLCLFLRHTAEHAGESVVLLSFLPVRKTRFRIEHDNTAEGVVQKIFLNGLFKPACSYLLLQFLVNRTVLQIFPRLILVIEPGVHGREPVNQSLWIRTEIRLAVAEFMIIDSGPQGVLVKTIGHNV